MTKLHHVRMLGLCLLMVLAAGTLAACGKKGSPVPPSDVPHTYPRVYPDPSSMTPPPVKASPSTTTPPTTTPATSKPATSTP